MKTCSTPGCDKPKHGKGPISGKDLCAGHYKTEYRKLKSLEKSRDKVGTPTVPERGRSVQQGKGEIITEHNAAFRLKILSEDYTLDPSMWKPYRSSGKPTGKYTNTIIRDSLGFRYTPDMRGKRPPLSVVKGKDTDMIEVYINMDTTEAEIWALLKEVREFLMVTMDIDILWPPEPFRWRKGPEEGKARRDYAIESKFVEEVREKAPELIGTQAERRATDEHDNAKIGDGSHDNKIEVNSKRQADIYAYLHSKYRHLPREEAALRISEEANDILYIRDGVDDIDERSELHGLSEGNASAAILRRIKEWNETNRLELTGFRIAQGRTETNLKHVAGSMKDFADQMVEFGKHNESHVATMRGGAQVAEALMDVAGEIRELIKDLRPARRQKRYEHLYKGKR